MPVSRLHATQSLDARSTNEVQQHAFSIIVTMVCHSERVEVTLNQQLLEPRVAQGTSSHLNADMICLCVVVCVEMLNVKLDFTSRTKVAYKLLVSVALLTTQMEIAMSGFNFET